MASCGPHRRAGSGRYARPAPRVRGLLLPGIPLCHGWASGPTAWLTEYVLGVGVAEPGCRRLRIDPHLGDLEWVEGTFPTPYGAVKIRHERAADGTVKSRVEAPRGVKAELVKHDR